ncbi:LysR family transcriptional regulator [Amycolatopsis silviterrae]|uniref:LysR family transcriptional regulator n=1 Tax=Amycolatopsis silviterrae TaxID=1656914 RepID=A0ABW5HMK6_9PSEU
MHLRKIEYFVAVAEEGSISLAAQRLHMTQPPLSQAILALEREFGAPLLRRHARGSELTPAGRLLLEQGRRLLRWSERLGEDVRRLGSGEAGRLRIASVPTFAWSNLAPLLVALAEDAPGLTVELSDPDPGTVLHRVREGEADLGFVATSSTAGLAAAHPELRVRMVKEMPLVLAARAGSADGASLADLVEQTWIVPVAVPGFPGLLEVAEELARRAGHAPLRIQSVTTLQTALPLIAAGLGVGLVPADFVSAAAGGIAVQDVGVPIPPIYGTSVQSADLEPAPALKTFLRTVSRHFGIEEHPDAQT